MKHVPMIKQHPLSILLCALVSLVCVASPCAAQRDHLTPAEVEMVRNTQVLDKRIDVFTKAAERRLLLLTDPRAAQAKQAQMNAAKQSQKDKELWGDLPQGTHADLLADLARIFDEAITNIDDVAARDEHSPLLPKALRKLGAAAEHFLAQLQPLRTAATETEQATLDSAIEELQEIIAAAKQLPPEPNVKPAKSHS